MEIDSWKIKDSKFGELIILDSHNCVISLASGQMNDEGKHFLRWVYPQKRVDGENEPAGKTIPLKVTLGSRTQAKEILEYFLSKLDGEDSPY